MDKDTGKAFDFRLFKRVLAYTKPYKLTFYGVALAAIFLSGFAVLTPLIVGEIIDGAVRQGDSQRLLVLILAMTGVLLGQVISQLCFNYYANWLGESVIRDIRINLFNKMIGFKMKYFDNSSIGLLVTRTVADLQRIGEIFSQGFFVIVSDLLKMMVVAVVMLIINWKLALIVFAVLPVIIYATRLFQRAMKIAFIDVRAEVSNLNSFVQERITGMKIVQLFTREKIESDKFREINKKHMNAWLKTVWYNSFFFPIADIVSSITVGLIVWYGGLQNVTNIQLDEYGTIFAFILLSGMLFQPLRQIADKFNTLQMGMVAAKQIGVHEFINSLPGGYQYNVKERGAMLSSGQRQLIAFLRAYVSNPSILVLDEATSSVDTYSEQLIQKATEKITTGRTSIIIAHRLATVKKADKILVMDAGKILESGTHRELLKKGGYYNKLYEAQFMAEEVA